MIYWISCALSVKVLFYQISNISKKLCQWASGVNDVWVRGLYVLRKRLWKEMYGTLSKLGVEDPHILVEVNQFSGYSDSGKDSPDMHDIKSSQ